MICLYAALLILSAINFKQFFIRNAKLMRSSPLFAFYLLIFCCLTADIVYSVFIVTLEVQEHPSIILLPPTFKVSLGFEQLCMMIELTFRVNQVISALKDKLNSTEEERRDAVISKRVLCMRGLVLTLIALFVITVVVWSIIVEDKVGLDRIVSAAPYIYGSCFAFLFLSLSVTGIVLACRLAEQRRLVSSFSRGSVRRETCFLVTILGIFSLSYVSRLAYDFVPEYGAKNKQFLAYMIAQISGFWFDIVPIYLILAFHRRNISQTLKRQVTLT